MDKNIAPSSLPLEETFDNTIRELREELAQKENIIAALQQQLEQLNVKTEDSAPELTPAWMPQSAICPIELTPKNRKIRSVQATSHDVVTRLRNTWTGLAYTNHLKQYVFVHRMVLWIWRNGYPVYANHLASRLLKMEARRWRLLAKLSDFAKKNETPRYKLVDAVLVEMPVPKVFPASDQHYLVSPNDRYTFPEIFVATIRNALVYGGTNLILADGKVVCHDLYDFERDYTSEELHCRTLIDPKLRRIRWLLHDETPEPIPVVASFVDACALNYAHWMTEVLPRIALFCAEERFHDVPIVINDGLHKNIMESLFLVVGPEREIIALPIGRALAIDELYLTSVAGYVPFERRSNKLLSHSHGVFHPWAFEMLRNHLNVIEQKAGDGAWPEKIFLRRNSGTRKITNVVEIERLMIARGYVIVEPEKLSFLQQVQLFENAKIIISPTGAALSNAIFCKPGTQVAVLMSKHENMIYRYWSNMLIPIKIKVSYVLSDIVENRDLGIHGDFLVNTSDVLDLLDVLECK